MSESKSDTPFAPETERRKRRRLVAPIGITAAAATALGLGLLHNASADRPPSTTIATAEPTPGFTSTTPEVKDSLEQRADEYKQESLSFAKTAVNHLSEYSVETTGQGTKTAYQLSNIPTSELTILQPGQERKRIVVTMTFGQESGSIEITGVQESREGMKNRIATTLELDQDNPVYNANPDAPVTAQDFITAINGVDAGDVRSIITFGQGIKDQVNGRFSPNEAPEFTNGKDPVSEIPTREQIHSVAEAVQP